jgi:hypothetical protein
MLLDLDKKSGQPAGEKKKRKPDASDCNREKKHLKEIHEFGSCRNAPLGTDGVTLQGLQQRRVTEIAAYQ